MTPNSVYSDTGDRITDDIDDAEFAYFCLDLKSLGILSVSITTSIRLTPVDCFQNQEGGAGAAFGPGPKAS